MNDLVTLLIPTHNRHSYLTRSIKYYRDFGIPIIVADSTQAPFLEEQLQPPQFTYLHLPGYTLTQKLAAALNNVETPLVVMCADDDFIVRTALDACISFITSHQDYSAVCGNAIAYSKERAERGNVEFALIYEDDFSFEIPASDPLERLTSLFKNYRNFFYAVHRTEILRKAFNASAKYIANLFLNEYITAIVPLAAGKLKEIPLLYHIREFADDSGDKTTLNLDAIFNDPALRVEYDHLVTTQAGQVAEITGQPFQTCRDVIDKALLGHAQKLPSMRNLTDNSVDKKIGTQILKIPFFGKRMVNAYRHFKRHKKLRRVIRSNADKAGLAYVQRAILRSLA